MFRAYDAALSALSAPALLPLPRRHHVQAEKNPKPINPTKAKMYRVVEKDLGQSPCALFLRFFSQLRVES